MRKLIGAVLFAVAILTGGLAPVAAQGQQTVTLPYYYIEGGQQKGPVAAAEIPSLVAMGIVHADTLVWTGGMAAWQRADAIPEFAGLFIDYYALEGQERVGPLRLDALIARIRGGETLAEELVWTTGLSGWVRADSLPELAVAFGPAPQPQVDLTAESITLPDLTGGGLTAAEAKKVAMVLGATLGVLFHEFGHAVIGEIRIPATGPEEDTADEFSALLLSANFNPEINPPGQGPSPEDRAYLAEVVKYSTLLWKHLGTAHARDGVETPWYDEHSDNPDRFGNTLCMIYGTDPAGFKGLADAVGLPEDNRQRCAFDQPKRFRAWLAITAPYRRDNGDFPIGPGKLPPETVGGKISVTFEPSKTGTGQALLPVLQASGMFTVLAEALAADFVWPRDFSLVFADCGVVNAFYDPQNIRIIMCWEGVEYFAGAVLDAEGVARH